MALLDLPAAMACRTSVSRMVSASSAACSAIALATSGGEQIAAGSRAECSERLDIAAEGGENDDACSREVTANGDDGFDAAVLLKAKVHQRNVGPMLSEGCIGFVAVGCFSDGGHVVLCVHCADDAGTKQRVIIDGEHADSLQVSHSRLDTCIQHISRELVPNPPKVLVCLLRISKPSVHAKREVSRGPEVLSRGASKGLGF